MLKDYGLALFLSRWGSIQEWGSIHANIEEYVFASIKNSKILNRTKLLLTDIFTLNQKNATLDFRYEAPIHEFKKIFNQDSNLHTYLSHLL